MKAFLAKHELGSIATIHTDKAGPESAVVAFAETNELELLFGTANTTRKYYNIAQNPHVAFVIGWSSTEGSMQYEGVAQELHEEEVKKYWPLLVAKNESHRQFFGQSVQRYFLVKPTWIRFIDSAGSPPDTYEISF